MADHVRKQIRAAAKTALTGLTTTGANAFASRVYPLQDANLPALKITTPDESSNLASMGMSNRYVERTMILQVEGSVKELVNYEDTCDQIAKEVETALANNNTLGGLCKYIQIRSTSTKSSGEAEKPTAVITMMFDVHYFTTLNAPDVPL